MRKLLLSFLLLPLAANAVAQLKTISGASIGNIELSPKEDTAIIEVVNKSSKDITGFVLAIDTVYPGNSKEHSEYTVDHGAFMTQLGNALHPGQIERVLRMFSRPTGEKFTNVEARVITVVYADQTAETISDDALSRLIVMRTDVALAYRESAEAMKQVLSDPNEQHPTGRALAKIREEMAEAYEQRSKEGPHADVGFLNDIAKELANAPTLAIEQKLSEREMVRNILKDKQRKADLYTAYSIVKELHEANLTASH